MKRLLAVVALLLFAAFANAQETYSVTLGGTTTNRASLVGQVDLGRVQVNSDVCTAKALAATCTQAQACVAYGVAGGAACTAADALAAEARIYPDSTGGRESFVANQVVRFRLSMYLTEQLRREADAYKSWCVDANQTARNTVCALVNAINPAVPATGCNPCGQ